MIQNAQKPNGYTARALLIILSNQLTEDKVSEGHFMPHNVLQAALFSCSWCAASPLQECASTVGMKAPCRTVELAESAGATVLHSSRGRAVQMNMGAQRAKGNQSPACIPVNLGISNRM